MICQKEDPHPHTMFRVSISCEPSSPRSTLPFLLEPWTIRAKRNVPAAGALAVGARAGVPDGFVRHDCGGFEIDCRLKDLEGKGK